MAVPDDGTNTASTGNLHNEHGFVAGTNGFVQVLLIVVKPLGHR